MFSDFGTDLPDLGSRWEAEALRARVNGCYYSCAGRTGYGIEVKAPLRLLQDGLSGWRAMATQGAIYLASLCPYLGYGNWDPRACGGGIHTHCLDL